jgi:hypothetical protein
MEFGVLQFKVGKARRGAGQKFAKGWRERERENGHESAFWHSIITISSK